MDIQIREATPTDAPGIARVHVDAWRSSYAGVVPEEILSGLSYSERETLWDDILTSPDTDRRCFVAETRDAQDAKIVGFASAGQESDDHEGYEGEIYAIYLLEDFQRIGLGRRLFQSAAKRLLDDGIKSMLLWVFEENHRARRFYESLGGELVARKDVTIGGAEVVEIAYGWKDITTLVR